MRRWVKSYIMSYDAKAQLSVLDKTSKAASDILKVNICVFMSIYVKISLQVLYKFVISDVEFFLYAFHAEYDSNSRYGYT